MKQQQRHSKRKTNAGHAEEGDRVRRNTEPEILARIDREIENSIRLHSTQPKHVITARIQALDREWDIERVLETNASTLAFAGVALALMGKKKALLLSAFVLGFLFQHAVSGWCPPIPVLRRIGFRTRQEIDRERYALKALRGDFRELPEPTAAPEYPVDQVVQAMSA